MQNAPRDLTISNEADVYPINAPEKVDLISGSIGEITQFQETFGYYARGLPPEACPLPRDWKTRLEVIKNENTRGITGLCLNPKDLACSKLAAAREKDLSFVAEMLRHKLVDQGELTELIQTLPLEAHRTAALRSLDIVLGRLRTPGILESMIHYLPKKALDRGRDLDGPERYASWAAGS